MIELVPEMMYHLIAVNSLSPTEGSPFEARQAWTITEGSLEGPRLKARLEGHGSDWLRLGADRFARPDVRMQFRTNDGATILLRCTGLIEQTQAFVRGNEQNKATTYDDQYLRIELGFETAAEPYSWLNTSLFVARGRLLGTGKMEFEVFRVA